MAHSTSSVTVRPYRSSDQDRVLELVNADRLVGQPVALPGFIAAWRYLSGGRNHLFW